MKTLEITISIVNPLTGQPLVLTSLKENLPQLAGEILSTLAALDTSLNLNSNSNSNSEGLDIKADCSIKLVDTAVAATTTATTATTATTTPIL